MIAGFLALISVVQPAAGRLHLPYTVLLAVIGVAVGGLASFLRYTPLTSLFDEIVAPVVNLPFNGFGRQPRSRVADSKIVKSSGSSTPCLRFRFC